MSENMLNDDDASKEVIEAPVAENATSPLPETEVKETIVGPQEVKVDPLSSLPEDIRSQLGDIKDIENLAKGYISAQSMIGRSIRIPSADASKEAIEEFYNKLNEVQGVARLPDFDSGEGVEDFFNKLGRPESPDKYKFETPEGIHLDGEALGQFSGLAHKMGLTQKQANELVAYEIDRINHYNESIKAQADAAIGTLKAKWGADFDNRLNGAKQVLNQYASDFPEAIEELKNSTAANNPAVVQMLSDLYGSLQESGAIQPSETSRYGMTPDEAKAQISDIQNNRAHPYHNPNDKEHSAAVAKMHRLYSAAFPE